MADIQDRDYWKRLGIPATKCLNVAKTKLEKLNIQGLKVRPENINKNEFRSRAARRMNSEAERKTRDEKEVMTLYKESYKCL